MPVGRAGGRKIETVGARITLKAAIALKAPTESSYANAWIQLGDDPAHA
jgi:hypothetical protein